jgi:hypothetical protein
MTEPKKSIADALNVTEYDESFAANADRAAEKAPVVGTGYKTGKSIGEHARELFEADDFGDLAAASGKLVGDGAAFVGNAALDATFYIFDPVNWLVSHGLDMLLELVQPLQDALHQVTGDGPAIGHASENFVAMAQGFVALADDFEKTGDTALKDWLDEAGDAARAALGDFSAGIRGVGSSAGSVADVLRMWSTVMVVIEDVIKAIISEFASWAICVWATAFATSVMSFGASVGTAMTLSVQKAATALRKVTKHLGVFGRLLDKFMALLKKLSRGITTIARKFRYAKYVKEGERAFPIIGKVAKEDAVIFSRRKSMMDLGLAAGAGPLVTNMGVKASLGAAKGVAGEAVDELHEDGPLLDKSDIGGDQSADDTRKNLDI